MANGNVHLLVHAQSADQGIIMMTKTALDRSAVLVHRRRFWFLLTLATAVSVVFWSGSRYPHLLYMAEVVSPGYTLPSLVSAEPVVAVTPNTAYYKRLLLNTVNWLYANRIGMGFGLLFGTIVLTLLKTIARPQSSNHFVNSMFGVVLGAPLGVCVNCAAPIAAGMLRGGSALATSLGTLFSAPTLNIIALVMAFSLLPIQIVLIKLGLSLLFLLFVIPWLSQYFADRSLQHKKQEREDGTADLSCSWRL